MNDSSSSPSTTMAPLPKHVVRTACIAGGLAAFQAAVVVTVSIILIIQHTSCAEIDEPIAANEYILRLLKIHYFQNGECNTTESLQDGIMDADQVWIWTVIVLSFSALWLLLSITLIIVTDESIVQYFRPVAYSWVASTASVVVIDITLGVFFGLDFGYLNQLLSTRTELSEAAYKLDLLRIGAFCLMTLALKGYVLIVCNIAYAIALIVLNNSHQSSEQTEHSVHTRGPLNAYGANKLPSDPWYNSANDSYDRRPYLNRGFSNTESTSFGRDMQTEIRTPERTEPWQNRSTGPASQRPFSYLDAARDRSSNSPRGKRDPWDTAPPVPVPDYSPYNARRLKSVLKPVM